MKRLLTVSVVVLWFSLLATSVRGDIVYNIMDLGSLWTDAYSTQAYAVNNSGQAVGFVKIHGTVVPYRTAGNQPIDPATDGLFPPFEIPDMLGAIGVTEGRARAINDSGQVAGSVRLSTSIQTSLGNRRPTHAFRHSGDASFDLATDDLGTLGGEASYSEAFGINDSGQVVGSSQPVEGFGYSHAFCTAPNQPINPATDDLGTFGGKTSIAVDINNNGQIVGAATTSDGYSHAFVHTGNGPLNPATDDLGTFGGDSSVAVAINDSGQIAGSSYRSDGYRHAFVHSGNGPLNPETDDLGTLGGGYSYALGINDSGQVVGVSEVNNAYQSTHAFLYDGDGAMQDLNDLIDPSSGWILSSATGVNDSGQIVGYGTYDYRTHAFLLTPIPEPSSFLLVGTGATILITYGRRRRH